MPVCQVAKVCAPANLSNPSIDDLDAGIFDYVTAYPIEERGSDDERQLFVPRVADTDINVSTVISANTFLH